MKGAQVLGTDWLYASGAISREAWQRLRPPSSPTDGLTDRLTRHEVTLEGFLRILAEPASTTGRPE